MNKGLSAVEGEIEKISQKEDKYGVMIDDEWYNNFGTIDASEGDKAVIQYEKNGEFNNIKTISILSSGENSNNTTNAQKSVSGKGDSTRPLSQQERINFGMAFNKAVDQVDRRNCETREDYKESVKNMVNTHLEIIEEMTE